MKIQDEKGLKHRMAEKKYERKIKERIFLKKAIRKKEEVERKSYLTKTKRGGGRKKERNEAREKD